MGETIAVGIASTSGMEVENERLAKVIYLFQIKDEWGIHAPSILYSTSYSRRYSLAEACEVARKFLDCEFLPLAPETILIHQIRAEGGDCQMLEHLPTGIRKWFSGGTAKGGEILLKRREALDELVYDLALKSEQADAGRRRSAGA